MPVEINELVIRASITAAESPRQAAIPPSDNEQKIQQVVDEALKKIDDKDER